MDLQKNIMDSIAAIAKENGYKVIDNSEWSNMGKVSISPVDTFANTIGFAYSFQSNYVSIQLYAGGFPIVGGMISKTQPGIINDYYIGVNEGRKLDAMLGDFRRHLPKIETKKKKSVKSNTDLLKNIARRLSDIAIEDLSEAEAGICIVLTDAGYLRKDGQVYRERKVAKV